MDEHERRSRLALFVAHGRAVLLYVRRRTDHATAADVLSEVFVVAWQRLEEIPADALPWLLGCARLTLLNQHRAHRRRSRLIERLVASTPEAMFAVEIEHDSGLAEALAALSERDREVLLLTAWEGLSAEQAARALGCSQRAVWVRTHRARKRLAAALDQADRTRTPLRMEACND
jgi:RNA polymerase sigma-70 factor, ECF subfamily